MSHDSSPASPDTQPWYRQFWPWFIIALPATTVVAGITTLVIAINNADDLVDEDWYREGRAINRNLDQEKLARQLGIHGTLSQREGIIEVRLASQASLPWPDSLTLALRHPTIAEKDVSVTLEHQGDGTYSAPANVVSGERYISLQSDHWRLATKARLDAPVHLGAST